VTTFVYLTVASCIGFNNDEWINIEQGAAAAGVKVERYLRDEPSLWWDVFAQAPDDIQVEVAP
jgi:hypothetical protein